MLDSNRLTVKGKVAFHLAMEIQLYDLDGKASEQGTVDEWWTESEGSFLTVNTPSLGTLHSLRLDGSSNNTGKRSLYLIGELLRDTLGPANTSGLPVVA